MSEFLQESPPRLKVSSKRVLVSDEDSEVPSTLAIESPLSDSSVESDSKMKRKFKKKSMKLDGRPKSMTSRICGEIVYFFDQK